MDPAQGHAKFVWLVALLIAFSVASLASFNDAFSQKESLTFGLGLLASAFLIPLLLSTIAIGVVWLIAQAFPGKRWTGSTWINLWALFTLALTVFFSVVGPWMKPFLERESAKALTPVAATTPQVVPEKTPPPSLSLPTTPPASPPAQPTQTPQVNKQAKDGPAIKWVQPNPTKDANFWYDANSVQMVMEDQVRAKVGFGNQADNLHDIDEVVFNCEDGSITNRNIRVKPNPESVFVDLGQKLCSRQ